MFEAGICRRGAYRQTFHLIAVLGLVFGTLRPRHTVNDFALKECVHTPFLFNNLWVNPRFIPFLSPPLGPTVLYARQLDVQCGVHPEAIHRQCSVTCRIAVRIFVAFLAVLSLVLTADCNRYDRMIAMAIKRPVPVPLCQLE